MQLGFMKKIKDKKDTGKIGYFYKKFLLAAMFIFIFPVMLILPAFPSFSYAQVPKAPFIIPLDGKIIVKFRQVYVDQEKNVERNHTGIDIAAEAGSKVLVSANGIVAYTGFSPIGGRTVVVKHNDKIRTTYLNLENIFVSAGAYVQQGDCIATIGAFEDPSSEMPHLHFGVIYNGYYLDPGELLNIDYSNISKFFMLRNIEPDLEIILGRFK